MESCKALASDDFCPRQAHYFQRWETPALLPKEILRLAVDHGLMSESEDAASDEAMRLAVDRGIDTAETDLLGLAEHLASLADFLAWLLRGDVPWLRPEPITLPGGTLWLSGAFLSQDERKLRSVALVDRWDAYREVELRHEWRIAGECAAYGTPMDVLVVEISQMRKGRWSSPFTLAYRHPVAKTLRFQKRDGEAFGGAWERVWRSDDSATREQWLDAMQDDGVLAENLHVLAVDVPERAGEIVELAERKLARIGSCDLPDPQLSRCFSRFSPCPFRGCCPNGKEPSEADGFRRLP